MTRDDAALLDSSELAIEYVARAGRFRALDGASLRLARGEVVAIVGESGSGKTTLGLAAGRMLAANAQHVGGELRVGGEPVLDCAPAALRRLRRDVLGFVFQNPVASLDPTMRVARQMELAAAGCVEAEPADVALEAVGLRDVPRVLRSYPHELSGGMAQRVAIAMAVRRRPRLLIADEPTAAVDATLRPQILELLVMRCRAEDAALVLLTHDLHAVARYCSRVAVMYGGRVVEDGPTRQVLSSPRHPYTAALVAALPGEERPGDRLRGIAGVPPVLRAAARGCSFAPRCPAVMDRCDSVRPRHETIGDRATCCHLHDVATPPEDATQKTLGPRYSEVSNGD